MVPKRLLTRVATPRAAGIADVETQFRQAGDVPKTVTDRASAAATAAARNALAVPAAPQAPADASHFKLHSSVDFWVKQQTTPSLLLGTSSDPDSDSEGLGSRVAQQVASGDPRAVLYWTYHLGRHLFFMTQGVGSLLAHRLFGAPSPSTTTTAGRPSTPLLDSLLKDPGGQLRGRLAEALATFLQDWEGIKGGHYKMPWDMTTPSHQQFNPLVVLSRSAAFMREAVATLDRRGQQRAEEVWMRSDLYPPYYTSTFHYQSDGWLSSRSASVYEFSTEVLFLGRQDAMQRAALLPLSSYLAGRDASRCSLLEVAAGTGRFHTFIKDNWPELRSTVTELSPFYLQEARGNMRRWKGLRAAGRQLGGADGTGTTYIQCAVERMPLDDESQDIVVCVYLLHELPQQAREAAAREMWRVLKPGGLLVLTDSVQLGDRPSWDPNLAKFGNFNEPHYDTYITCDMGAMFKEAGFQCGTKYLSSASKTLSFLKPATPAAAAAAAADDGAAIA